MENYNNNRTLRQRLESLVAQITPNTVNPIIRQELKTDKPFSLYELSDDVLLHIDLCEKGESWAALGFPFPIYEQRYPYPVYGGHKVKIFFRGEAARGIHRQMLRDISADFIEIADPNRFICLADRATGNPSRLVYVDPYDFIGDSFIGLEIIDSFRHHYHVKDTLLFSKQSAHMQNAAQSYPYDAGRISRMVLDGDVIIMPDLIESHWDDTLGVIQSLRSKSVTALIPGRNLIVEAGEGLIRATHLRADDCFLRESNIEDYLHDCMAAFGVEGIADRASPKPSGTSRFFVNPFANHEARYIPVLLFFEAYKAITCADAKAEFYLVGGYHKKREHRAWISSLLDLLNSHGCMRRMSINYYCNLTELIDHMEEKQCAAVLTSDTSIAHVANRLNYPNLTLYNTAWWDEGSVQSLAGSSPLGFCRRYENQIPVINLRGESDYRNLGRAIGQALLFMQSDLATRNRILQAAPDMHKPSSILEHEIISRYLSGTQCSWISDIYDPAVLTRGIRSEDRQRAWRLMDAALRISPIYKFASLKEGS